MLQPLSAYFLVKFRLSLYIPFVVTCWGATLACMSAARNFTGLLVGRFFVREMVCILVSRLMRTASQLGALEASIQSAFILVGQIWYRRHEQGFRVAGKSSRFNVTFAL
jgi:hypothetical protein